MVTGETTAFLAIFFDFGKNNGLAMAMDELAILLEKFAGGRVVEKRQV
jgi:hypothetical protein